MKKKMKYHKNPLVLTITEDDVEFVSDKVHDRGENALVSAEAQREDIMNNLEEF
jgi:hypothetical protein